MATPLSRKALVVFVTLFAALSLAGAQDLASVTGVVTDSSGAVVAGARVTLQNPSTSAAFKTITNSIGAYNFTNVAPGPGYQITFAAPGFKSVVVTGIYLNVTSTRTENAGLIVGAATQTLEVSAAANNVTLDTTDATVGNNFQAQELNDLPVEDRDTPSALFYQQPGVTLDGAVTGARTDQTNVTVDGLEANDDTTGEFGVIVANAPVDSVEEFRGVTADPLSSSGQGGGGQFELVTRSGTNSFHGAVVEYHRDTDTEANDWFNNNAGDPRPPLVRNQFGGDIGGPIWRNKAFFFFDYDGRRDSLSVLEDRTVPLGTNTSGYRGGEVAYVNDTGNVATLNSSQVASLDPQGIGWNQAELSLFQKRYPMANDLTGAVGDGVNTAGYRFNAPFPYKVDNYVQRVDFAINDKMKVFGRGTFTRRNDEWGEVQFPGDPQTYPAYDRSYAWVVGHTWMISENKLNQAEYGETLENLQFPVAYNPQGADQFSFAGLSGPYASGSNTQARSFPIPIVRDDFSWEKGRHSLTFGGTFKWETPNAFAAENYGFPDAGITGNTNFTALSPAQRPSDISTDTADVNIYDSAFSTALGAFAEVTANYDYNAKAQVQPQGSGLDLNYRFYETELYFGDTWKVTPNLDISFGLRYQNYTVPYETRGLESMTQLNTDGAVSPFSWDAYWKARVTQSNGGISTDDAVPFLQFIYGGKANNQPGYFHPSNKNFAPRLAFAYSPFDDKKSVVRGGIGIIYDHTLVNALQFQQQQSSYLFEAGNSTLFGTAGDPTATLASSNPASGGAPRFDGVDAPPPSPSAASVAPPYIPFVYQGFPYGLDYGEPNLMIDTNLKTPYSIQYNFGIQHEFPQGYLLKVDYVGRLGRRLLAEADASQLVDFPDNTGGSNQLMSAAEAGMVTQMRQNVSLGEYGDVTRLSAQPWFEDMVAGLADYLNSYYGATYFANNTQAAAWASYPFSVRGDFSDIVQALATTGFLGPNVGMTSQFATNTVWTNKGFSDYDGMLVTLHKNAGYGLRFDLNYTWSHSIDNVSKIANYIAVDEAVGFICDVQRPRECRGNSDFDAANYVNGNFIYELPFGRGKTIAATAPLWVNEAIGGWELSGLPSWHTGIAYNAYSNAYVAGFVNNAPALLIQPSGIVKTKIHGGEGQPLNAYANPTAAVAAFSGPTGFNIGSRNNLRGPGFFNLDLGLGKTFPLSGDRLNLKFRCDAFNAFNHPNFNPPSGAGDDITQAEGVQFGTITSTYIPPDSDIAARVLQGSLRLEF